MDGHRAELGLIGAGHRVIGAEADLFGRAGVKALSSRWGDRHPFGEGEALVWPEGIRTTR